MRHFARQAASQFGLEGQRATAGVAILLAAIENVLAQWRLRPTAERAALLEDTYVAIVVGGLKELASAT